MTEQLSDHTAELTCEEWRVLGFFYRSDDDRREWQLIGSRAGLLNFATILDEYAANPVNENLSEHDHISPHMYLEICTGDRPDINEHAILGRLPDLIRLETLIRERLNAAGAGRKIVIREEYAPTATYSLVLDVRNDEFDPASADPQLADWLLREGKPRIDQPRRYQTTFQRFLAGSADGIIFMPFGLAGRYLLTPDSAVWILVVWAVVTYSIYWIYSVFMHARYGQTWGKMACGVKVLDISEERIPSLRQAILREIVVIALDTASLVFLLDLILHHEWGTAHITKALHTIVLDYAGTGWLLLDIIVFFSNKKRRALHDYIAGTVVVRTS